MPIKTVDIVPVPEAQFHEIDYLVMKQVFETHNGLGRFYDEDIYRNELARLCRAAGFESVETEVPIDVSHKDFCKTYYMDLLVNRSVVYELKTVQMFNNPHRCQLLNYLLLCILKHGKLITFRTPRVSHEFVSTSVDKSERHNYRLNLDAWRGNGEADIRFKELLKELLADWGVFLEASLYTDAVVHFFGGGEIVEKAVEVRMHGELIGHQKIKMIDDQSAFFITSVKHKADYHTHLRNILNRTGINRIQWVNFDKHDVEFVTVT